MAVFTPVTVDEAAEWARRHFNIAGSAALSPIAEGIENTNYLFRAGENRYVLTIFEVWDAKMADYYAKLMRHLASVGAPAPAPLSPTDDKGMCWGDKPALLVPFIEGEWRQNPAPEECERMGDASANLHMAAAHFMPQMPNPRNAAWRRETAHKVRPHLPSATWRVIERALVEDAEFDELPLPAGACHCDLFRNNVLWRDGEISGVIDFYFGGDDALIFDLAVCACDWCFYEKEDGEGDFDNERTAALLRGYQRRRPFCDLESEQFGNALRTAALRFWISRLYDVYFPRRAEILKPHDPRRFENIYMRAREYSPPGINYHEH